MAPESNTLRPEEIAWLQGPALKRVITTTGQELSKEDISPEDTTAILEACVEEVAFLDRLAKAGEVSFHDRPGLLKTLVYQRKLMLYGGAKGYEAEVEFINGFLRRLAKVDWEFLGTFGQYDSREYWGGFRLTEA